MCWICPPGADRENGHGDARRKFTTRAVKAAADEAGISLKKALTNIAGAFDHHERKARMSKTKKLQKVLRQIDAMKSEVAAMESRSHHSGPIFPSAAMLRSPSTSGGNGVFKALDDNFEVAKATFEADPMDRGKEAELRSAGFQRVAAKMMAAEHARARDPRDMNRRFAGMGTPLFQNSHELADDSKVRYV